jgi:hypothetical protein
MKRGGMRGLLQFLKYLNANRIAYDLDHQRDDSIMVTLVLVGKRIEVDFFEDHIEYSVFSGDESVEDDVDKLLAMIEKFASD